MVFSFTGEIRHIIDYLEDLEGVDFKTTGTQLKKEGWRCIGPGLEFERLLEADS